MLAKDFTWNTKVYKKWFSTRSLNLKWMLLVILTLPFFAATWEMKESSGFSPLQVLGTLVFGFGFLFIIRKRSRSPSLVVSFYIFLSLLILNALLVLGYQATFSQFGVTLKILLPFVLFFYYRKYLNNLLDLEGFMITFLVASIFPIGTLYYEILFDPISQVYNIESRGGGLRLSGFYADLFGYMSHLICGFICYCYFYIKYINKRKKHFVFTNLGFLVVLLICLIGIYNLRHQASWLVFMALLLLFVFYIRKTVSFFKLIIFFVVMIGVGLYFYFEIFNVLFAKDINVYQGAAKDTAALNGRVYIWKKYFAYWEDFSFVAQWLGAGIAQHEKSYAMMSGGMHNDYVRYFFSTGILGIICYLSFLFYIIKNALMVRIVESKFLILSSVLTLTMYGISTLPLFSGGEMMYFLVAVISQIKKKTI